MPAPALPDGLGALRASPLLRWLGVMSLRNAVLVLVSGTLLGIVLTLLSGSEPGFLLSFFIIAGSLGATLGVARGSVHVFFPLPTLAFFASAVLTGAVHDSSLTSSTAGLSAAFLQWIAGIFIPAIVATVLVLLTGGGRWLLSRQLVSGQFAFSGRTAPARSGRPAASSRRFDDAAPGRRPGKEPWLDADDDAARPARDPRGDRAPWGDPRRAGGNQRPSADGRDARPGGAGQSRSPSFRPAPRDPGPQRQPRAPRDPWD